MCRISSLTGEYSEWLSISLRKLMGFILIPYEIISDQKNSDQIRNIQIRSGTFRSDQEHSDQIRNIQIRSGTFRSDQEHSDQIRNIQIRSDQIRSAKFRSDQIKKIHIRSDQNLKNSDQKHSDQGSICFIVSQTS
ncbi:unnamed protein product [Cuscuta epithymum]|uniref:Uncharacterized protein n=1 Tax=Cuscuta epithymum TaxID=186058 RepID=A0AAV0FNN3_9ASTE|nr:unnamed protein product [Cuscuta epithymum]